MHEEVRLRLRGTTCFFPPLDSELARVRRQAFLGTHKRTAYACEGSSAVNSGSKAKAWVDEEDEVWRREGGPKKSGFV